MLLFAVIVTLVACNEESPTAPQSGRDDAGQLYGTVFVQGSNGVCLTGAKVEVLDGTSIGKSVQQNAEQCVNGHGFEPAYRLTGLSTTKHVRIRASAPGYWAQERSVPPQAAGDDKNIHKVDFELFRTPDLALGFIYGTVSDRGGCLGGARVEVLDGSAAGKVFVQSSMDCSNNDGSGNSYFLTDLPLGTSVRIRASLAGYDSQERSTEPQSDTGYAATHPVDFVLTRTP